jgi:transformer-2 protein
VANATNPGNTLYVTGLSSRVTERDLEDHFNKEGKVASCFLVVEPRTRISRGFAFVTMDSHDDAERCIKYLNQSVLEGRYITVERSTLHQLCWQQSEMTSSYIHANLVKLPT